MEECTNESKDRIIMTDGYTIDKLAQLVKDSSGQRQSFLLAITKSSKSISEGANKWFLSETDRLKKEMDILEQILPAEVVEWNNRLQEISNRFNRALSFLNRIIQQAEQGKLESFNDVKIPQPPKSKRFSLKIPDFAETPQDKEEEKELNLVSAMLEVFDSASNLEKLTKEIERESERTINTAKLVLQAIQETKR